MKEDNVSLNLVVNLHLGKHPMISLTADEAKLLRDKLNEAFPEPNKSIPYYYPPGYPTYPAIVNPGVVEVINTHKQCMSPIDTGKAVNTPCEILTTSEHTETLMIWDIVI